MVEPGRKGIIKRVIFYETFSFLFVLFVIWMDEIIDLPRLILGAAPSPVNLRESLLEMVVILLLGAVIISLTRTLLRRMKYLEGIVPVCANCKKIRIESGEWQPIEEYIRSRSDAEFSHSLCPDCFRKLYPEMEISGK